VAGDGVGETAGWRFSAHVNKESSLIRQDVSRAAANYKALEASCALTQERTDQGRSGRRSRPQ
jgi:hypothetical protein